MHDDDGTRRCNIFGDTGSTTPSFADPAFDGDPVRVTEDALQADGHATDFTEAETADAGVVEGQGPTVVGPPSEARRECEEPIHGYTTGAHP